MEKLRATLSRTFSNEEEPSVKQFRQLVKENRNNLDPKPLIDYYREKFLFLSDDTIRKYRIERETAFALQLLLSNILENDDITNTTNLDFVNTTISLISHDQKVDKQIVNYMLTIMRSNSIELLEETKNLLSQYYGLPTISAILFSSETLGTIWNDCFVENDNTNQIFGPIIIQNTKLYQFKSLELVAFVLTSATRSFNNHLIKKNTLANALHFISSIIASVKTITFFNDFLPAAMYILPNLTDFTIFKPFLTAQCNDLTVCWSSLNEICQDSSITLEQIVSVLNVVVELTSSPYLKQLSLLPFISRADQLQESDQEKIFRIVACFDLKEQYNFFKTILPPWITNISTRLLLKMVESTNWESYIYDMLVDFMSILDYQHFEQDNNLQTVLLDLMGKISEGSPRIATILVKLFEFSAHIPDLIFNYIEQMVVLLNDTDLVDPFIQGLVDDVIIDKVFELFSTTVVISSIDFVNQFLEKKGIELLFKVMNSQASVDFLAAIVGNGPYHIVDQHISESFDQSYLAKLSEGQLKKLMFGVRSDSNSSGLLRIPSLLPHINDVDLPTPFDRCIYQKHGKKYICQDQKVIRQLALQYMDNFELYSFCEIPQMLKNITEPSLPYFPIYQFHYDMPHSTIALSMQQTTSFWILIKEIKDLTVLFHTNVGNITFNTDGIRIYESDTIPISINHWHLISISFANKTFGAPSIIFHIDAQNVYETTGYITQNIIIGSENDNNSIWYVSQNVSFETDLESVLSNGPEKETGYKIEEGTILHLIDYSGFYSYYDALGGEKFIFFKMYECTNINDFYLLLEASFNMLYTNHIEEKYFYKALHFILYHKPEFQSEELEQLLLKLSVNENGNEHLVNIFSDYLIFNTDKFTFEFLNIVSNESMFSTLLNTYVFFDLKESTMEVLYSSIKQIVIKRPIYIKRVIMSIISLPFLDKEEVQDTVDDPKALEKQTKLLKILDFIDNKEITKYLSFNRFTHYLIALSTPIALLALEKLAQIVVNSPNYFVPSLFNPISSIFHIMMNEKRVWFVLFSFLTDSYTDDFEQLKKAKVIRIEVLHTILYLLTDLIHYEIINPKGNHFSNQIICVLNEIATESQISECVDEVHRLCTLGFELGVMNLNTQVTIKAALQFSNKRFHSLEYKSFDQAFENISPVVEEAPQFEIPGDDPIPFNISEILESETVKIITRFAALCIIKLLSEKKVNKLLLFGCGIISTKIHQKAVFEALKLISNEDQDVMSLLTELITYRIAQEDWTSLLEQLYHEMMLKFSSITKFGKQFLISIFLYLKDIDSKIKFLLFIVCSPLFAEYMVDYAFSCAFLFLLFSKDILHHEDFNDIKTILEDKFNGKPFVVALYNDEPIDFITDQPKLIDKANDFISSIKKATDANLSTCNQVRQSTVINYKLPDIEYFKKMRMFHAASFRCAIRLQFFLRLNMISLGIEQVVSDLFLLQQKLNYQLDPPKRFMIVGAPHPLCVPQKCLPLIYEFQAPNVKTCQHIQIPQSIHKPCLKTRIIEINQEFSTPKCLEKWSIPPYVNKCVTSMFKEYFDCANIIDIKLLATPEALQCIGAFSKNSMIILLGASLEENEICLIEKSDMLCHYAAIEATVHGYYGPSPLFFHHPTITIQLNLLYLHLVRKFIYQNIALDIYSLVGFHFTIIFSNEKELKQMIKKIKPLATKMQASQGPIYSANMLIPSQDIHHTKQMWINQRLTTYDYLLFVNTVGGRSFNDFAQYPVFPWVLGDFDKSSPIHARDLSKPMGAQTPARAQRFAITYQETQPHYHYGTHYSHSAAVLHYMMRLEPFTLYGIHLHNGWDHRDRLFCDIAESWRSASESNQADLKELIPEFYTFPLMLENINRLILGHRSDGHSLDQVSIPSWSASPLGFVWQLRADLDNAEVASKIGKWIDLIFGYKQKGQAAIDAMNVFQPLSYDDAFKEQIVDPKEMKAAIDAINNFGQCPTQVFFKEHPNAMYSYKPNFSNEVSQLYISNLIKFEQGIKQIRVYDTNLYIAHEKEHHIGFPLRPIKINEKEFVYNGQTINHRRLICCSNISAEGLLLATITCYGLVDIYTSLPTFSKIATFVARCFDSTCLALSSQHYLICIGQKKKVSLFDVATGYQIVTHSFDSVVFVSFDEIHNFIIVVETNKLSVYTFQMKEVASITCFSPFTAISMMSGNQWHEHPYYITGHLNGSLRIWKLNVVKSNLREIKLYDGLSFPIMALTIFAENLAVIAIDQVGNGVLISYKEMNSYFVKESIFDKCPVCNEKFVGNTVFCTSCRRPVCKECYVKKSQICKQCFNFSSNTNVPDSLHSATKSDDTGSTDKIPRERSASYTIKPLRNTYSFSALMSFNFSDDQNENEGSIVEQLSADDDFLQEINDSEDEGFTFQKE